MDKSKPNSTKILLLVIIVILGTLAAYVISQYTKNRERKISAALYPTVKKNILNSPAGPDAEKIQQVISQITKKLAATRTASKSDRFTAQKFIERGLEGGMKEDPASIKNAIINLYKSLSYQYDLKTITDLAYYFSCLGRSGINPSVNFARSDGIIDSIHNSFTQNREDANYIRSKAVKIINYLYAGDIKNARRSWNILTNKNFKEPGRYNLEHDARILEAQYLIERKWSKRLAMADELIRVSPNNPKYYNYKGVASYHTGDHKLARQCFERAGAINPEYADASFNLDRIRQKQSPQLWIGLTIERAAQQEPEDFPYYEVYLLFANKGRIFVHAVPEPAGVSIVNIESAFEQGMELEAGTYQVQVSADGYETEIREVKIGAGEIKNINFKLAKGMGWVFVQTKPEQAKVRILNTKSIFAQGMKLKAGTYHVQVSADGYETESRWIELDAGEIERINFELAKGKGRIFVNTVPRQAKVSIANIGTPYQQGMELVAGDYYVQVSAEGYETESRWIELGAGKTERINFELAKGKGRIFVNTVPRQAKVTIANLNSPYQQGMEIKAGTYHVKVSAEGYVTESMWIELGAGKIERINFELAKGKGRIYVNTVPRQAKVTIANLRSPYEQGMELEAGDHYVQVSADGYEAELRLIELGAGEIKRINFNLIKKREAINNRIGMKFVFIQSGAFMMGSPSIETGRDDDEWRHGVKITKPYYIQTTEVTQGQWQAVMGNNPSWNQDCGDDCPVENVSWNDIQEFIRRLNRVDGIRTYRLPTEAEWEYACRAGSTGRFSFGNDENRLGDFAWYRTNSGSRIHRVAQKKSNPWGLYDMHGNVWEWCQDWYGQYPLKEVRDPNGPPSGESRVLRGGAFDNGRQRVRCAYRSRNNPLIRVNYIGFRLVSPGP